MILIIAEHKEGKVSKNSLEVISFGVKLAWELNEEAQVFADEAIEQSLISEYGVSKLHTFKGTEYMDSEVWTNVIAEAIQKLNPRYTILSHNSTGKACLGRLSVRLKMASVSSVVNYKVNGQQVMFKKSAFSGKAFAWYSLNEDKGIIGVLPHSFGLFPNPADSISASDTGIVAGQSKTKSVELKLESGTRSLTDSDVVVSGGRGLKEASNWNLIEELASILNAATACSRPVADAGWRPHHEHVGQTGIAIRPNVYIAIGISGAIQHLAGVNNSKKILVINKDAEAPFFKAADYGICGDLFDILPKLNEALKTIKRN